MLKTVLKGIKPTDKKLLTRIVASLKKLQRLLDKAKVDAKAVVGGSIAKDTYLKGDHDCDVFVKFDYEKYKDKNLSKELGKVLKPLKPELVHGSRDYYFIKNEIQYEIVPVFDIDDPKKAVNVTDMSPLHVKWVKDKVKNKKDLVDEIRLAKQFCKVNRVYGAESYIKGFSGHVLDILVIYYGGFEKFLAAVTKWKDKEVIDPENFYKGLALKQMNKSKIEGPLVVVDPVLPERNAAAALSTEKVNELKDAAKKYLAKPDVLMFKIKKITKTELKRQKGKDKLFIFEATPMTGKEDVVGAKLLKAMELIRNQLKFHDFILKEADWYWDKKGKALLWYKVDSKELFPIQKWLGPPLAEKERVESFKKKYDKTFEENGSICSYIKRSYVKPEQLIKDVLKDKLLLQKVKSIKIV